MKSYWLHKQDHSSCIVFLAGWGMDPTPFQEIPAGDHDLLLVCDYSSCDPAAIVSEIKQYQSIHLIAWSMGVWIAGSFFAENEEMFTSATAVNGTLTPIDEQTGIPPKPFDEMIKNFSLQVLESFYFDMFDDPGQAERFLNSKPTRSLSSIATELKVLRKSYIELGPGRDFFTNRVVGTRDKIFPARSQLRSWGDNQNIRIRDGHFPFYNLSSWDTIIAGEW